MKWVAMESTGVYWMPAWKVLGAVRLRFELAWESFRRNGLADWGSGTLMGQGEDVGDARSAEDSGISARCFVDFGHHLLVLMVMRFTRLQLGSDQLWMMSRV